jgi:hypothetical protein
MVHSAQTVHLSCVKISNNFERSPRSTIRCVQNDFWAHGMFGTILAPSCVKISIISNKLNQALTLASSPRSTIGCVQNDIWTYGIFSTNHAPIFNRHQHYLQIDQNEIPHDPRHLRVSSGASKTTSEAMVRSTQTLHLSCVKISNNFEQSKSSFHLSLVT